MSQESPVYYFVCQPKHNPNPGNPGEINSALNDLELECRNSQVFLPDKTIVDNRIESKLGSAIAGSLWQTKNENILQRFPLEMVLDCEGNSYSKVFVSSQTRLDEQIYFIRSINTVFVYGTLREGECRARLVSHLGGVKIASGQVDGQLFDLGEYPGMVNGNGSHDNPVDSEHSRVQGEIYQFEDISIALRRLDQEEGFAGYGRAENLYSRVLCRTQTQTSIDGLSWIYRYEGSVAHFPKIKSGDWLNRT